MAVPKNQVRDLHTWMLAFLSGIDPIASLQRSASRTAMTQVYRSVAIRERPTETLPTMKAALSIATRRELSLPASVHGFLKVSVIDATGRADRITVRLK